MSKISTRSYSKISKMEDPIDHSEVRYGTLEKGIITRLFKRTNYSSLKAIWRNMNKFNPPTITSTNEEGICLCNAGYNR